MKPVTLINPLPGALHYYESALGEHLVRAGFQPMTASTQSIEGLARQRKIIVTAAELLSRARKSSDSPRIVLWPTFGYFDPITWLNAARRTSITMIVHDVDPLRRQFGYGRTAQRAFGRVARSQNLHVVTHTDAAADRLAELTSVRSRVIPHPVAKIEDRPRRRPSKPRVLVLGQHKPARSIAALTQLAENSSGELDLRIVGRGWPAVPGWSVISSFVSEDRFKSELLAADVLVLPYDRYQQSGVLVRAFEAGIPAIGLPHPQMDELYGTDWRGVVRHNEWGAALDRILASPVVELARRRDALMSRIDSAWRVHLNEMA